jgi:hypothetical protein
VPVNVEGGGGVRLVGGPGNGAFPSIVHPLVVPGHANVVVAGVYAAAEILLGVAAAH